MNKQDFEEYAGMYSDCYKSLNGIRPSLANVTKEEIDSFFDGYDERITALLDEERKQEDAAVASLEDAIDAVVAAGAGDRFNALYWMFAETVEEGELDYELYHRGLNMADSHSYAKEIRAAVAEGNRERGVQ